MADEKVNMGPEENKPPETLSPPGQGNLPPLEENNAPAVSGEDMILCWLLCCPSRGATMPAVAMSSTLWRTAGFLPTTSGAWWRNSMRFSTSAVWKRPSSTMRKALTDFWTKCPEVHIQPKASTFVVLAFVMLQNIL